MPAIEYPDAGSRGVVSGVLASGDARWRPGCDPVYRRRMSQTPERVVRAFCAAVARRDVRGLGAFFTDDAVYHNMARQLAMVEA